MDTPLPPPEEPLESDCCGQGCQPCVFDIYKQNLKIWRGLQVPQPSGPANAPQCMSSDAFSSCVLAELTPLTDSCSKYTFSLPPGQVLSCSPGQHLVLSQPNKLNRMVARQYSIERVAEDLASFSVVIKRYPKGQSSKLISQWTIGQTCLWRGPLGNFTHTPNRHARMVLLGIGTGVIPLTSVIRSILDDESDETRLHLLCGFRSRADIFALDEFKEFCAYWNFTLTLCLSRETLTSSSLKFGDVHYARKIDLDLLRRVACPHGSKVDDALKFLISGSKGFERDTVEWLQALGSTAIYRF